MGVDPKIQDHGVIGDGRSAALVSGSGSIDWLCWPRFDSPSLFASLLDPIQGGEWTLAPFGRCRSHQKYVAGTNILETFFSAESGTYVLTDGMPALSEEDKRAEMLPEAMLIRKIRCTGGEGGIRMRFRPRPGYGKRHVRITRVPGGGYKLDSGHEGLFLACGELTGNVRDGGIEFHFRLKAGDHRHFALSYDSVSPGVQVPSDDRLEKILQASLAWWKAWSGKLRYEGPARPEVMRSALALKLMQFAPTGAIVAAPTTSLPEKPGGSFNWDYRFCWLRDSAFTIRALSGLGFREEGEAFLGWMLNATRITRPKIRVLYDLFGERHTRESVLADWSGYRSSRPVRIGNEAGEQIQLDVYGEVLDAVILLLEGSPGLDRETREMLVHFGEFVCRHWTEPDNGIWEPREKGQRHTHSLALCWTALDRLLKLADKGLLKKIPKELFRKNLGLIGKEIREKGWNPGLGSYTATLGGRDLDASLLQLAWYGFEKESSPRMKGTCAALRRKLEPKPGLLYRYEPSLEMGEGAFGICAFWLAEYLARGGGSLEEAREVFFAAQAHGNELGLFSEEVDPATGDALGNFPQAFTHLGHINAAMSLADRERREGDA
jgi:GH15 family glucan-1,4-alpha-glucosidase